MTDLKDIYRSEAQRYHALVSREDYQNNLLPAILAINPLYGKNVLELGAGTGRIISQIAPLSGYMIAGDISHHMLHFAKEILTSSRCPNWHLSLESHHELPFVANCADVIIAGWSFCYAAIDEAQNWQAGLDKALSEAMRVLRPGGSLILIESLGTGYQSPHAPGVLVDYLNQLTNLGFSSTWIRTDYLFEDLSEAKMLTSFFFGEQPIPMWETEKGIIVPECTGLWWKTIYKAPK